MVRDEGFASWFFLRGDAVVVAVPARGKDVAT